MKTTRTRALPFVLSMLVFGAAWAAHAVDYVPYELCCVLYEDEDIEAVNQRWGTFTLEQEPEEDFYLIKAAEVEDLPAFAALLETDPSVAVAEPNYYIESPEAVRQMVVGIIGGSWEEYADQTAMERIELEAAHEISRGAGVTVAVLDTGIDRSHPVFAGRLTSWMRNYLDDSQDPSETANGLDDDGDGFIDEGFGHGTMVAGLIALIAPEAKIMPLRVLDDEGRGTVFNIARAITHATAHGAHVLTLSFGAPQFLKTIYERFHVTGVHGVFIVAGAGNRNMEEPPLYPGSDARAMMVAAVDSLDIKADFSDYHSTVLLSAPGTGIRSAYPGGEWGLGSGCSFATPMIAAECALILSLQPNITAGALRDRVAMGVDPIDDLPGNEPYRGLLGSGRVNLLAAIADFYPAAAEEWIADPLTLRAFPNPSADEIRFWLPGSGAGRDGAGLQIVDSSGRLVRELPVTDHGTIRWNGRDARGRPMPAGVYWARPVGDSAFEPVSFQLLR